MKSLKPIMVKDNMGIVMVQSNLLNSFITEDQKPKKEELKSVVSKEKPDEKLNVVLNGSDNLFPNKLRKILRKSPIYKVGLQYSAQQLMGLGEQSGKVEVVDNVLKFNSVINLPWNNFKRTSRFTTDCYIPAAKNLKTYYQVYVLFALNKKKEIGKATVLSDHKCRIILDDKNIEMKYCAVGDWEKDNNLTNKKLYRLIDGWYDPKENLKKLAKDNPNEDFFVYHIRMPSDGDIYSMPEHFTIVESGLLDYANNIVNFKKWVMENLTRLDKIFFITEEYLAKAYPQYESLSREASQGGKVGEEASKKIEGIYTDIATKFQNSNSGIEKSGKMIIAPMLENGIESVKFVKIDQNSFDSQYNADAEWVEKQILWVIQVDSAQYSSSSGNNANGGSNKNQAYNIAQMNEWMFEQFLMEIPTFISEYNGYGVDTFKVLRAVMQSSDAISPKDRQTQDPTAA